MYNRQLRPFVFQSCRRWVATRGLVDGDLQGRKCRIPWNSLVYVCFVGFEYHVLINRSNPFRLQYWRCAHAAAWFRQCVIGWKVSTKKPWSQQHIMLRQTDAWCFCQQFLFGSSLLVYAQPISSLGGGPGHMAMPIWGCWGPYLRFAPMWDQSGCPAQRSWPYPETTQQCISCHSKQWGHLRTRLGMTWSRGGVDPECFLWGP